MANAGAEPFATLFTVEQTAGESGSDLVPLYAPVPPLVCPLLHSMVQENASPSKSLIRIVQFRF